jgi:hypothetical protein
MFSMIISFSHIKENRDKRSGAMAGKSMNTTLRHGVMSRIVETFEASVSGRPEVYLKITKANKKSIREEVRAQLREQGSLGVEDPEVFAAVFRALGNHPAYLDRDLDDPMLWDDWRRRSIDVPKKAFHVVRFVVADAVELVITIMPENVQTETVDRGLFANMKSS